MGDFSGGTMERLFILSAICLVLIGIVFCAPTSVVFDEGKQNPLVTYGLVRELGNLPLEPFARSLDEPISLKGPHLEPLGRTSDVASLGDPAGGSPFTPMGFNMFMPFQPFMESVDTYMQHTNALFEEARGIADYFYQLLLPPSFRPEGWPEDLNGFELFSAGAGGDPPAAG